MQLSYCSFLFVAFLAFVEGQQEIKNIRSISSGISYAMCFGYCQQSINITSNPAQLIATRQANFVQQDYPPLQQSFAFLPAQWNQVMVLINLETFRRLPNIIGCPGCTDGGAEWIEIDGTDGRKRVTLGNDGTGTGIEGLLAKLRQLRKDYRA